MAAPNSERKFLPAARFRALTPYFDRFVSATLPEKSFKRQVLERAEIRPGERVLDLGVGTGTLAIWIKDRHPEATVMGIDADPEILGQARDKIAAAGVDVDIQQAYAEELPFEDASVDVVVSTLVFHHLSGPTKRGALKEVARVLAPGGRFYVGDWGKPKGLLQEVAFLPSRLYDGFEVTADNRRGALPKLFADAGLTHVSVDSERRTALGTLAIYSALKPTA